MTLDPDTPIVVLGDDWGRHVSTIQHLVRCLAAQHTVLWVNSFGHRLPRLTLYDARRAMAKVGAMLRPAARERPSGSSPTRIIHPRALPWHGVPVVRALNAWSISRDVRATLADVAPGRAPVLLTATPALAELVGSLGECASVYFCMDDFPTMPEVTGAMIGPLERATLARVDAVIATAAALVQSKRPDTGRAYYLPQGVNAAHFATARAAPAELAALPRPIIGFAGSVQERVDLVLLADLARAFPHGSIAIVGPVQVPVEPARLPANVHFFGRREYADLPAWVQAFDVGIIPYLISDWTRAVDPLKLLEYLASGIPVVATALPEVEKYADVVAVGATRPEFVAAVRAALSAPGALRERRRAVADANTWETRAARLSAILAEVVRERPALQHRVSA